MREHSPRSRPVFVSSFGFSTYRRTARLLLRALVAAPSSKCKNNAKRALMTSTKRNQCVPSYPKFCSKKMKNFKKQLQQKISCHMSFHMSCHVILSARTLRNSFRFCAFFLNLVSYNERKFASVCFVCMFWSRMCFVRMARISAWSSSWRALSAFRGSGAERRAK